MYAPGDVNAKSMLFHSAIRQSLVAGHAILAGGQPAGTMNFEAVPMTVFTEPEAAHVRLTGQQAAQRYGETEVTRYDYSQDARAQILAETGGPVRVAVAADHASTVLRAAVTDAIRAGGAEPVIFDLPGARPDDDYPDAARLVGAAIAAGEVTGG